MSPLHLLAVFLGAGTGGVLRYAIAYSLSLRTPHYPWATLTVNLVGSIIIGMLAACWRREEPFYALAAIGILGGFTTFSSFSLEVYQMLEQGRLVAALGYVLTSVIGGVVLCGIGYILARGPLPSG